MSRREVIARGLLIVGFLIAANLWNEMHPKHKPFVYHYQWPGQFGDQQMTICLNRTSAAGCMRGYLSDEL